jgi:hypothetical protein
MRDLLGDLLGAKNAGVTTSQLISCMVQDWWSTKQDYQATSTTQERSSLTS